MTTEHGAVSARVDPRVSRTRVLLQDALLALARERELEQISVGDIADTATVNRSTFYQHYADKDTLLADALDEQAARAGADLSQFMGPGLTIGPSVGSDSPVVVPDMIARYMAHVAQNAQLYRRALGEHGSPVAIARLRRRITALTLEGQRTFGDPAPVPGVPSEIVAASIAGSLLGVLTAWLEQDPLPPSQDAALWAWLVVSRGAAGAVP